MQLTWTTNGNVWLALHGDQWAKIQEIEESNHPFWVYVGYLMDDIGCETKIDTTGWYAAGKFKTLEHAQTWAAEKMGVEK
jgi:hypothetical protein